MWSYYILSLHVCFKFTSDKYPQIDLGSPLQLLDAAVFEDVISIFITSAILKFIQGMAQMPILY
jgi:callose synthase